jgi:chromosome partitioning protein
MGLIYTVATIKGGVGKTSFISNLAAAIVRSQPLARVLIVNSDPKGNLAIAFGKSPVEFRHTIYDVFVGEAPIQEVKVSLIDRLDLLPANHRMFTFNFAASRNPLELLTDKIEEVREQYDFIFIDTPSDVGMLMGNVLGAVDRMIIPFEPELFAVAALIQMTDVIQNVQKHRPELVIDGIVAMKVDEVTGLNAEMLPLVREYCRAKGLYMYETFIPKSTKYVQTVAYEQRPAYLSTPRDRYISPYGELVKEVLEHAAKKSTVS